MSDFARWSVAAEMLILVVSLVVVVALEQAAASRAPRGWRWVSAAVGVVLFGVTVAVILNALIAGPQTPGVKLLATIAAPADILGLIGVGLAIRHRPQTLDEHRESQVVANAPQIAEALSHLKHLEPCPNPDCVRVRRQLRELAGENTVS